MISRHLYRYYSMELQTTVDDLENEYNKIEYILKHVN